MQKNIHNGLDDNLYVEKVDIKPITWGEDKVTKVEKGRSQMRVELLKGAQGFKITVDCTDVAMWIPLNDPLLIICTCVLTFCAPVPCNLPFDKWVIHI